MMKLQLAPPPRPQDRLLILDDDPYFGALLSATARRFGFVPTYYASIFDLGPFARIKDFDLAIIDVYMGCIRGDELAECIDMFCSEVPVILVSGHDLHETNWESRCPESVRSFMPKTAGPLKILEVARSTLQRERLLRRLAATTPVCSSSDQDLLLPGDIA